MLLYVDVELFNCFEVTLMLKKMTFLKLVALQTGSSTPCSGKSNKNNLTPFSCTLGCSTPADLTVFSRLAVSSTQMEKMSNIQYLRGIILPASLLWLHYGHMLTC